MMTFSAWAALSSIDAKNVRRDPLLRWLLAIPVLVAALLGFGVPWVSRELAVRFDFDLSPYFPLIMSWWTQLMPMLVGTVTGFLLLDERDDGTLRALRVTPLGMGGYLAYRLTVPMLLGVAITLALYPLVAAVPMPFPSLLAATLSAAPLAPLFALVLACYAANKVQGFALMKVSGLILWPPIIAYFFKSEWQLAFGIAPTYWSAKLFWVLQAGDAAGWVYFNVGLAYQVALLWHLSNRFQRGER